MAIQDQLISSTKHFEIIEIDSISDYSYLLVLKSHTAPSYWLKTEKIFNLNFSGQIILDRMLHVGNSKDRFIIYSICDGNIQDSNGRALDLERKNPLRVLSNSVLRNYPELVSNSILNSSQKKLLLHGLSI